MSKILKKNAILAWHFLPNSELTANGENIRVFKGQTLRASGEIVLCDHGYHASVRAIDALKYAPGEHIQRVIMWGNVIQNNDKLVASNRTCLWLADATCTLHEFAIWCAEQALDNERNCGREVDARSSRALEVKRLWLDGKATDGELDAVWDAAREAVWAAVWAAARAAAREAARAAAREVVWAAARVAARVAARAAAREARDASAAARAAAKDAQNKQLEAMLLKLAN